MILSASGWRKVFAASGNEEDTSPLLSENDIGLAALIAETFYLYLSHKINNSAPSVVVGVDTRPTGSALADIIIRVMCGCGSSVAYTGVTAAPEIMAYAKGRFDGFVYISASHNPIGHNGVKFGLSDGGVIPAAEAAVLIASFKERCRTAGADDAARLISRCTSEQYQTVMNEQSYYKTLASDTYQTFSRIVIAGTKSTEEQNALFSIIKETVRTKPLTVVCDMNGSARVLAPDRQFLDSCGIHLVCINNTPGAIAHAIIPEPENLIYCAQEMERLQKSGRNDVILGYMPDCDGDRGNIVYWDEQTNHAHVLKAQEVFALSVLSELAFLSYTGCTSPTAVAVNDPTSMRIEEIAACFGAQTVRAEVGEANVVNCARNLRNNGITVRILGEGSNGGNITHPAAVRDPLNTLFALIKLLAIRDNADGTQKGLFHEWCCRSNQIEKYRADFTLSTIIATLPPFTTTGVSEKRAVLSIKTNDHVLLKRTYQKLFLAAWERDKKLFDGWHIKSWNAVCNNGTKQTDDIADFGLSGKGGLKIIFYRDDARTKPDSFIWMRGSGTEPVFRVMCDVQGNTPGCIQKEADLLLWHSNLIQAADCAADK